MYHGDASFNRLKCDVTLLHNDQDSRNGILLLNFNLPEESVADPVELPQRLQEISTWLTGNFGSLPISYQLSASYWLRHQLRGDRERWVGSFFARESAAASLSGAIFLDFNPRTWVQSGVGFLAPHKIIQSLTVNFLDSAWHYEELISVIVQCQLLVPITHPFVVNNDLQRLGRGRSRRR